MLELTRGQIIEEGLDLAARPDLTSNARLWLNLFLEKQYYNQDYDWLIKTVDGLAVVQGGTLPSNYRAARSATIVENGKLLSLTVVTNPAEWDEIKETASITSGVPRFIYIDHDTRLFYFPGEPVSGLTWNLKYYHIPDLPDHTDPTTDMLIPKWGLPADILVQNITARAFEYNDDSRQDSKAGMVEKEIGDAKKNNHDRRGGKSRLALGKSFRKRFGGPPDGNR